MRKGGDKEGFRKRQEDEKSKQEKHGKSKDPSVETGVIAQQQNLQKEKIYT
jgi:hypothetical protein